jgi:hypothetical protein
MTARSLLGWLLAASLIVAGTTTARAGTPAAVAIGRLYNDTMDTRLSAERFGQAMAASAYVTASFSGGRTSFDTWNDGQRSSVIAIFGHSNSGIIQTDEGPTDAQDEIVAAGTNGTLSFQTDTYGATSGLLSLGVAIDPGHWTFWKDYLPFVDADDVLLAILAGCFTANFDPSLGSFLDVGRERGMDAVVGWTGLSFYPSGGCVDCDYSGNFFFGRFSFYLQTGDTVSLALSKARADLVAKEASAGGWDTWLIGGALSVPGDTRTAPARVGQPLNSSILGLAPFNVAALTPSSRMDVAVAGASFTDVQTAEGVVYRLDAAGALSSVIAPASTAGASRITTDAARAAAESFAAREFAWIHPGRLTLITSTATSHAPGEARHAFVWRSLTGGAPGPALLAIDVDLHTGAVVYAQAIEQRPATTAFSVDRERAIGIAAAAVPGAQLLDVRSEVWTEPRWVVRWTRQRSLFPDVTEVIVNGVTGRILSIAKT